MQIYDPMCEEVAIVGISNGYCLLIESLEKSSKIAAIKKVWKLRKKVSVTQDDMVDDEIQSLECREMVSGDRVCVNNELSEKSKQCRPC